LKNMEQAAAEEDPVASSVMSRTRKVSKVGWALLAGLVLLFIVPWPGLVTGYLPDHPTLLFSWSLAVFVGLIGAWLVKEPGRKWEQRARQKPSRPISPLWWAAILPIPSLLFVFFAPSSIPNWSAWLSTLLFAAIVSAATALIVKIRMSHPRIKSPEVIGLTLMVLATLLINVVLNQVGIPPIRHFLFEFALVSIAPALLVRVPGKKQQVEESGEPREIGAGAAPKVVGWILFILVCNFIYAQVSSTLYLNQGQSPLPPWTGGNDILLSILMAICLIPALVVKTQAINRRAAGARQPAPNNISPKVWILALPILFLTFVTQIANFIGPNFSSFEDVFMIWLQSGIAALIILLAFRLGARKTTTRTGPLASTS
jgi:hypothetical protein